MGLTAAELHGTAPAARLDWLLRFDPRVAERHEAEHGRDRVAALRQTILIGLILYNAYNLTSIILMPDILAWSVAARLLVVSPIALLVAWLVGRVGPAWRETIALIGIIDAFLIPVLLFWLTDAPLGAYTFGEFTLTLFYGNMLLALRFPQAVVFTAVAFASAALAAATKAGLDPGLRGAFVLQIATGCLFSLYANHRMERRRCRDYLTALAARLDSEAAEAARRRYQDLSRTDALTGLPNRRSLDSTLGRWFADDRSAALMMIDIDHFKLFNDTLGHPAGDDCLCRVSALFAGFAPGPDTLFARFGGEEFIFAVRDADAPEAARLAAGLVQAVEALGLPHPSRSDGVGVVTISVGIALKPAGSGSPREAIFAAADRALYQAKCRGRNRYAFDG
ncbi:GGDEF domain-containing protein [Methylobacterium oryzisoli]|uniref:GGDEF domain-containing protein n=1 Tax=Methylobacterium oryzisoli TaxID=3385502 RepID=UPI00389246BF